MTRFRKILEIVALLAFIGFILLLAWFAIHGARKVKSLGDEASATLTNLDRTIVIAAGAFTNLEKGGRLWKENSDSQAKQTTAALTNLNAAAKSLDSLISSTNNSLNTSLLPNLSRAIDEQNAALLGAVTEATATLADADRIVANPRLTESVDNLADSSKSLSVATASGAATMQKIQSGVEYEVNQIEKPVKKVKVIFLFILTALGHFFGYA